MTWLPGGMELIEAAATTLIHYLTNLYLFYVIVRFAIAMTGSIRRVSHIRPGDAAATRVLEERHALPSSGPAPQPAAGAAGR